MPVVDYTGGAYRDATRGATIKALQARQAAIQEEQMKMMQPQQIRHPLQGIGQVANVISAGIREGRAADQEMAGRQRMAELMAGGVTDDEMGELMGLDPDTAKLYQEHNWKVAADEAAARLADARRAEDRSWQVEDRDYRTQAEKDAAAEAARVADASREDTQLENRTTAETLAKTQEAQAAADLERERQKTQSTIITGEEAAKRGLDPNGQYQLNTFTGKVDPIEKTEQWGPVTPEIAAKYGGDVARNPGNYHVKSNGDIELINPSQFSPAEQEKRTFDTKSALSSIDAGLDDMTRALELAPQVTELGSAGRYLYGPAGMLPESVTKEFPGYKETADATARFDQLTKSNAIQRMAATLAGSDSDKDVQRFIEIMANPNSSLTLKKQTLSGMISKLQRERAIQAGRLREITGQEVPEYAYSNPDAVPGETTPPATGGGGGGGGGDPLAEARDAIAKGAPRDKVIQRLKENGIDPTGL